MPHVEEWMLILCLADATDFSPRSPMLESYAGLVTHTSEGQEWVKPEPLLGKERPGSPGT